jgi:hypothetical protein
MATHTAPAPDKGAAFTGLITAAVFLLIVVFTIVKLTNNHYNAEKANETAAEAHK